MRINHNIMALNAYRQLSVNNVGVQKSLEKLSSGLRINRAGDDAAGLAISEKMRGQIRGLEQASRNAQDAISLIQTAEGALNETHAILQRMRELVVQAGNTGTNQSEDLQAIQDEIKALIEEIDGIGERTQFNGKTLLNGDFSGQVFQIGANTSQILTLTIDSMKASALGATATDGLKISDIDVEKFSESGKDFDSQLAAIDKAIGQVSSQRSKLGATQNRLEHTIKRLDPPLLENFCVELSLL